MEAQKHHDYMPYSNKHLVAQNNQIDPMLIDEYNPNGQDAH